MNILVIGGGGREHTLCWKLKQSKHCKKLFAAPGNAGTAECGQNIAITATDFAAVAEICLSHQIDLILPGNEDPLVAGIVDFIAAHPQLNHIMVAGPSKAAAQLEGSKDFSKILLFKSRRSQIRLSLINFRFSLFMCLFTVFYFYHSLSALIDLMPSILLEYLMYAAILNPFLSSYLIFCAIKAIRKDDDLVSSIDRIR